MHCDSQPHHFGQGLSKKKHEHTTEGLGNLNHGNNFNNHRTSECVLSTPLLNENLEIKSNLDQMLQSSTCILHLNVNTLTKSYLK